MTVHTIDATKKTLGRVASEAAKLLMGKNLAGFERRVAPEVSVRIENVSKLSVTAKKRLEKVYRRHSHYPGGEHYETLDQLSTRKGMKEIMKKAVYGMLPDNRLRAVMMKNLTITE